MRRIRLNIGGEKGNAFIILGLVHTLGRQLGMTPAECENITDEMKGTAWKALGGAATGYDHLLSVFLTHFPMVELYAYHELGIDPELYTIDDGSGDIEL